MHIDSITCGLGGSKQSVGAMDAVGLAVGLLDGEAEGDVLGVLDGRSLGETLGSALGAPHSTLMGSHGISTR